MNIGILKCGDDEMTAVCSVRSSVASQKQMVRDRLRCLTEQLGAVWTWSATIPLGNICRILPSGSG